MFPSITGQALWIDIKSASLFLNTLYHIIPEPFSGNVKVPAKGHTVAPPAIKQNVHTRNINFQIKMNLLLFEKINTIFLLIPAAGASNTITAVIRRSPYFAPVP